MFRLITMAMKPAERLQLLVQIAAGAAGLIGTLYSLYNKARGSRTAAPRLGNLRAKILAANYLVNESKKTPESAKKSLRLAESLHDKVTSLLCSDSDGAVLNEMIEQAHDLVDKAVELAKRYHNPVDEDDKAVLDAHEKMVAWAMSERC